MSESECVFLCVSLVHQQLLSHALHAFYHFSFFDIYLNKTGRTIPAINIFNLSFILCRGRFTISLVFCFCLFIRKRTKWIFVENVWHGISYMQCFVLFFFLRFSLSRSRFLFSFCRFNFRKILLWILKAWPRHAHQMEKE